MNNYNKSKLNKIISPDLNNTPVFFNKKIKKLVVKPLKHIFSDTGKTKHFTPAAQEWYNSIYSFNKNYIKSLPSADKNLIRLLKSYFNYNLKLNNFYKIKLLATRYKRLSAKKIFVGKGELKHTNNKVIITFFVYNTEKMFLLSQFKRVFNILFSPRKFSLKKYINVDRNGKEIITYNRPFTLKEYLNLTSHTEGYSLYILQFVNKLNLQYNKINTLYETLTNLVKKNILNRDEKLIFINIIKNINTFNYPDFDFYMKKCYWKYTKSFYRLVMLIRFNQMKFSNAFLAKLTRLISNIYNKKIEFNMVNLKKMHLNSDIFTQAVSLKLRNRDNKLYRVLKSSLRKLKIRNVSRLTWQKKADKNEYYVNNIRNSNISSMFAKFNVKDPLNNLLLEYFPWKENLNINIAKISNKIKRPINMDDYILHNLKHREMAGIRVEAKGRLTRRFTASRSVFKMKWKGGLKNVDSSFRGLSAIMLRGHVKSNVQYSLLNSKNRNGAFGIKGWVSNK